MMHFYEDFHDKSHIVLLDCIIHFFENLTQQHSDFHRPVVVKYDVCVNSVWSCSFHMRRRIVSNCNEMVSDRDYCK